MGSGQLGYILSRYVKRVFWNDFGSFCANQNLVNEANIALYIFQGRQVGNCPLFPIPAGAHGRPVVL